MSKEPRLFKDPNGVVWNVEVATLHGGLSRCRSQAEDLIVQIERDGVDKEQTLLALANLVEGVWATLHGVASEKLLENI